MKKTFTRAALWLSLALLPISLHTACASRHQSTASYVGDQMISARIKSNLLRDPVVHGSNIQVITQNHEVYLNGFVASQDEKTRASQIAAGIPGVRAVRNALVVRTGR